MPDDPLSGLWNSLKSAGAKVEGGLEGLWQHLKSGEQKAEAASLVPGPIEQARKTGEHIGEVEPPVSLTGNKPPATLGEMHPEKGLERAAPFALGFAPGNLGEGMRQPPAVGGRAPSEPEAGMPRSWTVEPVETPKGPVKESPETLKERLGVMEWTQDRLHRLHTQASSDMLKFTRDYGAMLTNPEERLSGNDLRNIEANIEWQQGMPNAPVLNPRAQRAHDQVMRIQDEAHEDYRWLQEHSGLPEELVNKLAEDEGYLHRMEISPRRPQGNQPFSPFGGIQSLRQQASSQKRPAFYVVQKVGSGGDAGKDLAEQPLVDVGQRQHVASHGDRIFMRDAPPAPYGSRVRDSVGGQWEIKRATMPEVEANTDVRYLHDPRLTSLSNLMQLRLARRNVEALQGDILPELERRGLASKSSDTRNINRPGGFEQSTMPTLRGWWFEPRLARAFDDFYRTPNLLTLGEKSDLGIFGAINRFAINAMFLNPVGHMRNVLSDYALARSGLWGTPTDQFAGHMRSAFSDVVNKSPFYHEILKNGGALMGADASNKVAMSALMGKIREEMALDPMVDRMAKETGVWDTGRSWGQRLWDQSQRAMWGFHDMLMIAQTRALMAHGRPLDQAIQEAEKYIANYRVPASIGEGGSISGKFVNPQTGRFLSRLMQDRTLTVFGRYHYNKLHAIANVIREGKDALIKDGVPTAQRQEQLARLSYMLIASTIGAEAVNAVLQQVLGNPYAKQSVAGAVGLPARAYDVGKSMMMQDQGDGWYEFINGLQTIITPMPAIRGTFDALDMRSKLKDLSATQQLEGMGAIAGQEMLSPVREGISMLSGRGMPSLGISVPDKDARARAGRPASAGRVRSEQRLLQREIGKILPLGP